MKSWTGPCYLRFFSIVCFDRTSAASAYQRRSKADFIRYDADLSGDLDRNEIKQLLTDLRIDNSDESISKVFARFDKDHSDSIDFEEFIEWASGSRLNSKERPERFRLSRNDDLQKPIKYKILEFVYTRYIYGTMVLVPGGHHHHHHHHLSNDAYITFLPSIF